MNERLHHTCARILGDIDGGVALAAVDLATGKVLASQSAPECPDGLIDEMVSSTRNLVRGSALDRIAELVAGPSDDMKTAALDGLHVASPLYFHFTKVLDARATAVVLVTKRTTSIGMGWAQLKAGIAEIEEELR